MSSQSRFTPTLAANLALRLGAVPASFAITLLLSKLLGAADYGLYAYALAWGSVLAAPAALGFDGLNPTILAGRDRHVP